MQSITKIVVFSVCCALSYFGQAQHTFFNEYNYLDFFSQKSIQMFDGLETSTNYVLVGEKTDQPILGKYNPVLLLLNKDGAIEKVVIDSNYNSGNYRKIVNYQNDLFCFGRKWDTLGNGNKNYNTITKYSETGIFQWSKTFGDSVYTIFDNYISEVFVTTNGFAVFGSSFGTNGTNNTDGSLIFLNDEGDLINQIHYTFAESIEPINVIRSTTEVSDGFVFKLDYGLSLEESENILIKTDKLGNELWRKVLTNYIFPELHSENSKNYAKCISAKTNGNIIVNFINVLDGMNNANQQIFAEFDPNGNFINANTDFINSYYEPKKLVNNGKDEFYFFGTMDPENIDYLHIYASKLDENHNIIWNYNWGYNATQLFNGVAILTNDGGVLVGGSKYRLDGFPTGYNFFLVKTDCNGNLEWNNQSCIVPSNDEIVIFGNPMTDHLLIQLPTISAKDNVDFKLYNSIGQLIVDRNQNGNIINEDVSKLSQGIYLYIIQTTNGNYYKGKLLKN